VRALHSVVSLIAATEESAIVGVERFVADRRPRRVLDAGCGRTIQIDPGPDAHITGLDVSATELTHNHRLDVRIVGDVQSEPLATEAYDLVVCFDVLEHVDDPARALANLASATAPGGTLIVKCPNAMSFKGLVTKASPWWFHRWLYRKLVPFVAQDPFPTSMRLMLRPETLSAWAAASGFVVERFFTWEAFIQRRLRSKLHLDGASWRAVSRVLRSLTLGRVAVTETELLLVLSKSSKRTEAGS
jgi:2-polyprenyl-3-methyl-5-hydroxy-6-metoxy-1,4-benzoquinol methylase